MKKISKYYLPVIAFTLLSSCSSPQGTNTNVNQHTKDILNQEQARLIAESSCLREDESLSSGYYDEITKAWWFEAELKTKKEGCNPACVVTESTQKAEINWSCIGSTQLAGSVEQEMISLFIEKYPKYAATLSVTIDQQTEQHVRGNIKFETDTGGGIFFATKIDGQWQIVFDGNGHIPCDLSEYGFPNQMLTDCTG
jgi:hypothetical protein